MTLVSREVEGAPSVSIDPVGASKLLVQHLAALGHRSLVYLAGPKRSWLRVQRWHGIRRAAAELGVSSTLVGDFSATYESGPSAAGAAVAGGVKAIIAHNDLMAIGVIYRLQARGVSVPQEVSVAGFDDIAAAAWCFPSLTTVSALNEEVGRLAVESCLARGRSTQPNQLPHPVRLPPSLSVRASTGATSATID